MKNFHTGGIAGADSKVSASIDRVNELLKMPAILPDKATLADVTGKITKISTSPVGGWDVEIGDETHYVPAARTLQVAKGDAVERGDRLSSGAIDPRELLDRKGMDAVQRYLTDELHAVYRGEGVRKRNAEVVIKGMTNLGRVVDAGDSDEFLRGDLVQLNYAHALNKEKGYKEPAKVEPTLRGLEMLPLDASTDWMGRLQYRRLKETFTRGAAEGWVSQQHGMSPIPGVILSNEFGLPPAGSKSPY
jgi:DNA-directed RNA polymerase subunit beta'